MSSNLWKDAQSQNAQNDTIQDHTIGIWQNDDFQITPQKQKTLSEYFEQDSSYHYRMIVAQMHSIHILPVEQLPIYEEGHSLQEIQNNFCNEKQTIETKQANKVEEVDVGAEKNQKVSSSTSQETKYQANEYSIPSFPYNGSQADEQISTHLASIKTFMQTNEEHYKPHIASLIAFYYKVKSFNQTSLNNLSLHKQFFQKRLKQEEAKKTSIKPIISEKNNKSKILVDKSKIEEIINTIQQFKGKIIVENSQNMQNQMQQKQQNFNALVSKYKQIFVDQQLTIRFLEKQSKERKRKSKFSQQILIKCLNKITLLQSKIIQRRKIKQNIIQEKIIQIIKKIQKQMNALIHVRLNAIPSNEIKNYFKTFQSIPYIHKDLYLQIKYLMNLQQTFMKLIQTFNRKFISYISNTFQREQPLIRKILTSTLLKYHQSVSANYDLQESCQINCGSQQQSQESYRLLLQIIPLQLYKPKLNETNLGQMLIGLNSHLQNMFDGCILFEGTAYWKQSEEKTRVQVILSSNHYLHLEKNNQVATIKLADVKLRVINNLIELYGKKNVYLNKIYLLGTIEFGEKEDVDIFISKIIEGKSFKKQKELLFM